MVGRSSPLGSGLAEDRIDLDDVSGPLGPSLFVIGHSFLLSVGLGLSMRWAGVVKFFNPTNIYKEKRMIALFFTRPLKDKFLTSPLTEVMLLESNALPLK